MNTLTSPIGITLVGLNDLGTRTSKRPAKAITEEIYDFIEGNAEEFECYRLAPAHPGTIRAAAIDFFIVLYSSASVASLASFLWLVYEKVIARRKNEEGDAGIIVTLDPERGLQLWIGRDYKNKDVFLSAFTECMTEIQESTEGKKTSKRRLTELKSDIWIRTR